MKERKNPKEMLMRTLVISDNALDAVSSRLRGVLRSKVDDQGPAVAQFDDVEARLSQVQPEMAVVVLSSDPERGLEVLRKVRRVHRGYVLAVGQASEPKFILRALHEGADHFLDEADLEAGLNAVLERLQNKEGAQSPSGRLIAVLGASGGSGASTLSINIAAILAQDNGKCALLDLKPGRGDLAALLDLKPSFHLANLCLNVARLDRSMFEKMLVVHPCGVHLLASPQVFGDTRLVTAQGVSQALTMARRLFSHVVVDLEDCFHEEQALTLRQANAILLVSRLDFTSLRNVRRILEHLNGLDVPASNVRLVVNRQGQPNELPIAEAEEALGGKQAYCIPDDPKTINAANNTGIPAVLKTPTAKVCQSIAQLARSALERRKQGQSFIAKMFAR
jgi:pilus assembly protein CpaE